MSLTNTDPVKTEWFPKFNWTRIGNPTISKKHKEIWNGIRYSIEEMEGKTIRAAIESLRTGNVAAIIIESIQDEGGDNHYRPEFVKQLPFLADIYNVMFVFDEVQAGISLTGAMWAYEHFGVKPDMMCFGKKAQVCDFCSNEWIDSHPNNVFKKSGRINFTWGGNIVDMVCATAIIKTIKDEKLVNYPAAKDGGVSAPTNCSTLAESYVRASGSNVSLGRSDRA